MNTFEVVFWTFYTSPLLVLAGIAARQYRRDEEVSDLVAALFTLYGLVWMSFVATIAGLSLIH